MYAIEFTKPAAKELSRMPADVRVLIRKKIETIAANPHGAHNNVTRLIGRPEFRLRVQDWRVIYEVQDGRLVLLIIKVAPRGRVYE